jgi:hypothetical protein
MTCINHSMVSWKPHKHGHAPLFPSSQTMVSNPSTICLRSLHGQMVHPTCTSSTMSMIFFCHSHITLQPNSSNKLCCHVSPAPMMAPYTATWASTSSTMVITCTFLKNHLLLTYLNASICSTATPFQPPWLRGSFCSKKIAHLLLFLLCADNIRSVSARSITLQLGQVQTFSFVLTNSANT